MIKIYIFQGWKKYQNLETYLFFFIYLFNFASNTNRQTAIKAITLHTHIQWLRKTTTARAGYVSLL